MALIPRNIDYSLKNCPIPNEESYLKSLIHKTEHFINRLRWRVIFFLKLNEEASSSECESEDLPPPNRHFGFPSPNRPPIVKELCAFENDLWCLVDSVEFSNKRCKFQKELERDVKSISKSKNLIVQADKTRNLYEMKPKKYEELLNQNITAIYKKTEPAVENNVNSEAKKLAEKLDIADRVEVMSRNEAFITVKDHKPNFQTQTKCRLINPAKSEMGKVSSIMLKEINECVREKSGLKQWRSTKDALDWFKSIENKRNQEFVQMDIVDFYPSISKKLLQKAIRFAKKYTPIDPTTEKVIMNSRKTILFNKGEPWTKQDELFDVSMGAFDGAEVAELVGLLILHRLRQAIPKIDFGLYRDDGLGRYEPMSGPRREQARKKIIKIMEELGLRITIEFGLARVDFLDVNMDLGTGYFRPFRKPNDTPSYIHRDSNHPPNCIKELPKNVNRRLSSISCNETVFNEAIPVYQAALDKSGHKHKLKFEPPQERRKKQRKRVITFYNPPFNAASTINLGKEFLKIIDRHFPKNKKRKDKLEKCINRHNIKISYSGTKSVAKIISSHNAKILRDHRKNTAASRENVVEEEAVEEEVEVSTDEEEERGEGSGANPEGVKTCSCQNGVQSCPLDGKCLTKCIVYKATLTADDGEVKTYIGLTEPPFKKRL